MRVAGLCVVLFALAACSGAGDERAGPVEHDATPQRVVVSAPAAAEMLDALDLLDRVAGIGDYGPWPAAIRDRPAVGGYDAPNVERLLRLRCDLFVTAAGEAGSRVVSRLEPLGIPVLALETGTYEGVLDSLLRVGRSFDRETRAIDLAARMREQLAEIGRRAAGAEPRRVLFVVGRDPLYVAGPGSYIDEMIERVGGVNVAADALGTYQQVSLEAVLERAPQVIVDSSDNRPGAPRGRSAGWWSRWEFLPAVHENRVFLVDPGLLAIPGMRLPRMTELVGKLVHPEIFGEPTDAELGATP